MFDFTMTRRAFVNSLNAGWLLFAGACVTGLGAFGRFMMPAVLFEPAQSFKAGFPDDYELGVSERFKNKFGVWIVRTEEQFYVLSVVCTHLGCTPNYLKAEAKIKCPCHGSGFKETGINFEGPAPRPLERFAISLAEDGQLYVDKTRKFQQELGQWDDPAASLTL
jgi:cytochrome b6-f complex iron-sulfur subunit